MTFPTISQMEDRQERDTFFMKAMEWICEITEWIAAVLFFALVVLVAIKEFLPFYF